MSKKKSATAGDVSKPPPPPPTPKGEDDLVGSLKALEARLTALEAATTGDPPPAQSALWEALEAVREHVSDLDTRQTDTRIAVETLGAGAEGMPPPPPPTLRRVDVWPEGGLGRAVHSLPIPPGDWVGVVAVPLRSTGPLSAAACLVPGERPTHAQVEISGRGSCCRGVALLLLGRERADDTQG